MPGRGPIRHVEAQQLRFAASLPDRQKLVSQPKHVLHLGAPFPQRQGKDRFQLVPVAPHHMDLLRGGHEHGHELLPPDRLPRRQISDLHLRRPFRLGSGCFVDRGLRLRGGVVHGEDAAISAAVADRVLHLGLVQGRMHALGRLRSRRAGHEHGLGLRRLGNGLLRFRIGEGDDLGLLGLGLALSCRRRHAKGQLGRLRLGGHVRSGGPSAAGFAEQEHGPHAQPHAKQYPRRGAHIAGPGGKGHHLLFFRGSSSLFGGPFLLHLLKQVLPGMDPVVGFGIALFKHPAHPPSAPCAGPPWPDAGGILRWRDWCQSSARSPPRNTPRNRTGARRCDTSPAAP